MRLTTAVGETQSCTTRSASCLTVRLLCAAGRLVSAQWLPLVLDPAIPVGALCSLVGHKSLLIPYLEASCTFARMTRWLLMYGWMSSFMSYLPLTCNSEDQVAN
jgi:hypothetical protein